MCDLNSIRIDLNGLIADQEVREGLNRQIMQLRELLNGIRPPVERPDDFNPMDASGANFDDAYQMGCDDGERYLAASIREIFGF